MIYIHILTYPKLNVWIKYMQDAMVDKMGMVFGLSKLLFQEDKPKWINIHTYSLRKYI